MKTFRVFFKLFQSDETDKSDAVIEFKAKKFRAALDKAEKQGIRKKMRVIMIAEVLPSKITKGKNTFPEKL